MIAGHMRIIVDRLIEYCPEVQSVVLAAGFGRGEGGVALLNDEVEPLGDYKHVKLDKPPKCLCGRTL